MDSGYFAKFPTITYNGVLCRDISKRARVSNSTLRQPTVFYPFEINDEQRPDTLAFDYYKESELDWLIMLSNGIIDPYYGWYLNDDEFNAHIVKKYGSIEEAEALIDHWETNWSEMDINVAPNFFESQLPDVLKKYWVPNYGLGTKVIGYRRRQEDWTTSTNKIVSLTIDITSSSFSLGERVSFFNNGLRVGNAEIVTLTDTEMVIQHVQGAFETANTTIRGTQNGGIADITAYSVLQILITTDEATYWSPITCYDFERELNEANKFITLVEANYISDMSSELKKKLNT